LEEKNENLKRRGVVVWCVTFVGNDGDEEGKRGEKWLESVGFSLFSPLDYIWRRNPCMEAKIKKREW